MPRHDRAHSISSPEKGPAGQKDGVGFMVAIIRTYLVPGLIFQSVMIGGGYATGRELIAFFFDAGPIGALLGLAVSGVVFGVVLAAAFEFARVTKSFEYRTFCKRLLGPAWIIFEIAYILLLILILSVIGSASGEMLNNAFSLPPFLGAVALIVFIGLLTFLGSDVIARFLAGWSFLLYAVYITLFVLAFTSFGEKISAVYSTADLGAGWIKSGVTYAGYNLAIIPAVLFAITHMSSRRETIGAGLIAGAIAVAPAILFFVAMMGLHPEIADAPVPALALMSALNEPILGVIFQIVVFGTFIETGAGLLHAVNERIGANFHERGKTLPRLARPIVASVLLSVSVFAATAIGIVDLIAKGYGALTYVFIAVLIVPLLTIGVWKIVQAPSTNISMTHRSTTPE